MKPKNVKWLIGIFIVILLLIIGIGGKKYMNNQIDQKVELERQAVVEIKNSYKNIKKIKITDFYESSPRVKNIDFDVTEIEGTIVMGNSMTIGNFGSYSDNGLTSGNTKGKIEVIYTTGEKEIIE